MYRSLQACRGLAALVVVLYHARGAVSQPKYFGESALGLSFIFGGSLGVDFFFVLSGFIIVWIHAKDIGQPQRLGAYLSKRALRIYPTYWIIFAAAACAALVIPALRPTLPADGWMLLKALLLVPIEPPLTGGTGAPVLTVAWSLQFEVMFYLFVALAIVSPRIILLAIVLWIGSFAACIDVCRFPLNFIVDFKVLLFALGGATAWLCRATEPQRVGAHRGSLPRVRPPPPWLDRAAVVLGAMLFVGAATWDTLGIAHGQPPGWTTITAMYGMASALVIFGMVKAEDRGVVRGRHAAWQLLGGASYALYLIHYPVISAVTKAMVHLGMRGVGGALVTLAVAVCTSIAVAVVFHLRIEQPMLRALGSWRPLTWRAISNPKT